MTRAATWALWIGVLLFIGVIASQGLPAIMGTPALAGLGLLWVALLQLLPLALDAAGIRVLFDGAAAGAGPRVHARRAAYALGGGIGQQPDARPGKSADRI